MIMGLFRKDPAREARQLNKDAVAVLDLARGTYRADVLREIARITRDGIAQLEELCAGDENCRAREIDRYKSLHRESRRQFNQVGLTAYTLVIIHGRSLYCGEAGAPARQAIDEFLAEWPDGGERQGTLPG